MIQYILTNTSNNLITYNPANNHKYYIQLNKVYDLSQGIISVDEIRYDTLIGKTICAIKQTNNYIIPCGAYMFSVKKDGIIKTDFKFEHTIYDLKKLIRKKDISINRVKELLDLDIMSTRKLVKIWVNKKEVNFVRTL